MRTPVNEISPQRSSPNAITLGSGLHRRNQGWGHQRSGCSACLPLLSGDSCLLLAGTLIQRRQWAGTVSPVPASAPARAAQLYPSRGHEPGHWGSLAALCHPGCGLPAAQRFGDTVQVNHPRAASVGEGAGKEGLFPTFSLLLGRLFQGRATHTASLQMSRRACSHLFQSWGCSPPPAPLLPHFPSFLSPRPAPPTQEGQHESGRPAPPRESSVLTFSPWYPVGDPRGQGPAGHSRPAFLRWLTVGRALRSGHRSA